MSTLTGKKDSPVVAEQYDVKEDKSTKTTKYKYTSPGILARSSTFWPMDTFPRQQAGLSPSGTATPPMIQAMDRLAFRSTGTFLPGEKLTPSGLCGMREHIFGSKLVAW